MTTSKGSCSQVTLLTYSDLYREFRISELPRILDAIEVSDTLLPLKAWKYRDQLPSGQFYAIDVVKISMKSLASTLERIERLIMTTESGVEYKLNSLFRDRSVKDSSPWSTRPGTLRVFSSTLACYYDGKSWRKIDVR